MRGGVQLHGLEASDVIRHVVQVNSYRLLAVGAPIFENLVVELPFSLIWFTLLLKRVGDLSLWRLFNEHVLVELLVVKIVKIHDAPLERVLLAFRFGHDH